MLATRGIDQLFMVDPEVRAWSPEHRLAPYRLSLDQARHLALLTTVNRVIHTFEATGGCGFWI
jgi:hypothetical protein